MIDFGIHNTFDLCIIEQRSGSKEISMNERRIWKMCRLALFEQEEGKKDLAIASYYKRDYIGIGLLTNFLQITVVYLILLAAVLIMNVNELIEHFDEISYPAVFAAVIVSYVLLLGLYSVLVYTVRKIKYVRARGKVRDHYRMLNDLYEENAGEAVKKYTMPDETEHPDGLDEYVNM